MPSILPSTATIGRQCQILDDDRSSSAPRYHIPKHCNEQEARIQCRKCGTFGERSEIGVCRRTVGAQRIKDFTRKSCLSGEEMRETLHIDFVPFFIVGFERSGTTLLAAMLDRHSTIAVTPETHFFDLVLPKERTIRGVSTHAALVDRCLSSPSIKDMALESTKLFERFKRYNADYPSLFRALLEEYAENHCKSIIGEKTPEHLPYVPVMLRWYPQAKVICLVRDGRDAALSAAKAPWHCNKLRRHCGMWRWYIKRGLQYEKQFPGNFIIIQYEDLLLRPKETLMQIDGFLNVDFEHRQLDPSIPTDVVPQWEQQWKGKVYSELDPSRIGAWRETDSSEELWIMNSMMQSQLKRFHYPDVELKECPLSTRLKNFVLNLAYLVICNPRVKPCLLLLKHLHSLSVVTSSGKRN